VFQGYLEVGGTEILNAARAYGYSQTADCPVTWFNDPECPEIADALGDVAYDYADITSAPWYDPQDEATTRFFGAYPLTIQGLDESTAVGDSTQNIGPGGVIARERFATRVVKVKAMLVARELDALEAGMSWLAAMMQLRACATHDSACGDMDLHFFANCPSTSDEADLWGRNVHGVRRVSGPIPIDEFRRKTNHGDIVGRTVQFVFEAASAFIYANPEEIALTPTDPTTFQDIYTNLVRYPSAQIRAAAVDVVVATNYSPNPSCEVNVTGWASGGDGTGVTTGVAAPVRDTTQFYVGAASARATYTAPAAGSNGYVYERQEVTLPTGITGLRYSCGLWALANVQSGTAVISGIDIVAIWRNAGVALRTDVIQSAIPITGGYFSLASIQPPAGATTVILEARAKLTSWASGAVVRLFADACLVSVP
jgi:hypothetical protein